MSNRLAWIEWDAYQIQGSREYQNDSYAWNARSGFVADGVGDGLVARSMADAAVAFYTQIADRVPSEQMALALCEAPARLASQVEGASGATTVAGALIDTLGMLWTVSHGDSLILHVRNGYVQSTGSIHNRAAEQRALDEEPSLGASSLLTRSLSALPQGASDVRVTQCRHGDVVLAMSDGFSTKVSVREMVDLATAADDPPTLLRSLLARFTEAQGDDNATCLVGIVHLQEDDQARGTR